MATASASIEPIEPIAINGRYFWKGDERFMVNGVAYQLYRRKPESPNAAADPLADEALEDLKLSLPLFKELGLNTLFVFSIDASKNHDEAMRLLAEAGIYVLTCVASPSSSIRRSAPFESYTPALLNTFFGVVDEMSKYPNTLGLIVANEVINSAPSTPAAPVVRAVTRDIKQYMRLAAEVRGQRVLPLGVSAADVMNLIMPQFHYFCGGGEAGEEVEGQCDFYSFNTYSWVGEASMQISGYNRKVELFQDTHVPVFFSEYGAHIGRPRIFRETEAIYSPEMAHVFSGGIVYEFMQGPNNYGLVKRLETTKNDDYLDYLDEGYQVETTLGRKPDFVSLSASLRSSAEHRRRPRTLPEYTTRGGESGGALRRPAMPLQPSNFWRVDRPMPECPLEWDDVQARIEDAEWVDVEQEIRDLPVEDLAATMWERFRIDGTGPAFW
ncbi:glycolipid anchored surface protein [Xylariomycetidae sp. FL2044]|nr:glycolipid anchored surface protein [Xylariomycetidae sp. FL2044]